MTGLEHRVHIGLAAAKMHKKRVVKRADCSTGGLYTSPLAGQALSPSNPFTISWDTSCLGSPAPALVDVYLYAPALPTPLIHVWTNVPTSPGTYTDTIKPQWWNATASSTVSLQLLIVDSGTPSWMTSSPSGPIFTVATPSNYTSPTTSNSGSDGSGSGPVLGTPSNPDSIYQSVSDLLSSHGISKGVIAAVVLVPILLLIVAAVFYIRHTRKKEAESRKRWSQALDKRMSVVSSDWKSMSAAGVRASIAVGSHRASLATSTYFPRPSSTFASEGGQAGVGAHRPEMAEAPRPSFHTVRTFGTANLNAPNTPTSRLSRVSFAPTMHPRLSLAAREILGETTEEDDENDGGLSPTQLQGPTVLGDADVARGSMDESFRTEVLQMPAMTMMRTGRLSTHVPQPLTLTTAAYTGPAVTVSPSPSPKSPLTGMFPPPSPSIHMSPDEQLRAYAARRAASPMPPVPAANGAKQGMRVLYDPAAHQQQAPAVRRNASGKSLAVSFTGKGNPYRSSTAGESVGSRYSQAELNGHEEDDVSKGTAA